MLLKDRLVLGCFDEESKQLVDNLKNQTIIDIYFQSSKLKIDPVFVLSNEEELEIFSTDTYEPWTFRVDDVGFFVPTPSQPEDFR